jgi:hypothetical protein
VYINVGHTKTLTGSSRLSQNIYKFYEWLVSSLALSFPGLRTRLLHWQRLRTHFDAEHRHRNPSSTMSRKL